MVLRLSCDARQEAGRDANTKRELFVGIEPDEEFVRNFTELRRL